MAVFFAICDYLNITPMEFFDESSERPEELRRLMDNMKKLNKRQLKNISEIVEDLTKIIKTRRNRTILCFALFFCYTPIAAIIISTPNL